jgi:hypothetical protein
MGFHGKQWKFYGKKTKDIVREHAAKQHLVENRRRTSKK